MAVRVLAPMDGSQTSFQALEAGLRLLQGVPDLQVTLFNVVSEGLHNAPAELVEQFDTDEDDEIFPNRAASMRMLDKAKAICEHEGVPARLHVVEGKVVDAILAACPDHDLLLMHSLGRNQLKEAMRGSQTEKLARRAGIHVLLMGPAGT